RRPSAWFYCNSWIVNVKRDVGRPNGKLSCGGRAERLDVTENRDRGRRPERSLPTRIDPPILAAAGGPSHACTPLARREPDVAKVVQVHLAARERQPGEQSRGLEGVGGRHAARLPR